MADDNKLDADFGVPAQQAPAAPKADNSAPGPFNMEALGAKLYQSATLGYGADLDRVLFGKQAEETTRGLEKSYDKSNPFWALGMDLAVGSVEGAALGAGKVVQGGAAAIAKGAAGGAAYGAAAGFGSGGTVEERTKKAGEGALTGTLAGGAAGVAGTLLKGAGDRLGKMGFSQPAQAAQAVQAALKKDGKTPQELESFMKQNPNARIADFSPAVADLVGSVGGQSNKLARQLGTSLREDAGAQLGRLQNPSQPLLHVKQQLASNLQDLQKQMQDSYKSAYSEVVPLSPELKKALDHPDVAPLVKDTLADYGKLRMNPSSNVAQAPKYKVGEEIPTAVVDDLQKRLNDAAKDPAAIGKMKAGALQAAHAALKDAQPESLNAAHRLAATVGGEDPQTGVRGAEVWGGQFAMGLKAADPKAWEKMNPLQRQYARIGMVGGMERYLRDKGQMTEGALTKLGEKMDDPVVRNILGAKEANQVKKAFAAEAARSRVSNTMASGGSKRAQFQEENTGRAIAHMENVGVPGAHNVVGTAVRLLKSIGVPEARASSMIDIATKPGGLERLRKAGTDKKILDVVARAVRNKPAVAGRVAAQGHEQTQD